MPKFLEKLQQIIRERGQMPPWMEEFIEPVEVSEKESDDEESDLMKEIMREIVIRATETDSDDEVITDMEDDNENGENYDELEERKKGSEKETENEATYGEEDEDNGGNGDDHEELEVKGRRPSEKGTESEARDEDEDNDKQWDEEWEKKRMGQGMKKRMKNEEKNGAGDEEARTTSLKGKFVKIEGSAKCICQVDNCKKELHLRNKKEHLRAIHRLLPPLECNFCSFTSFSRSVFNRHKKKVH